MIRFAASTLFLLALSAAARAETTGCTEITNLPYGINAPGTYCLRSSLTGTSGIWVGANDVTVDLNGNTLNLQSSDSTSIGVATVGESVENVTVRNGIIRGGGTAVQLNGPGHVVERLRVVNAARNGIYVHGPGGVVRNNIVTGVGGPVCCNTGIWVSGTGVRVSDNQVLETGLLASPLAEANGIRIDNASGAVIERNLIANTSPRASGFHPVGISISSRSPAMALRMTVAANRIVNMTTGIVTRGTPQAVVYLDNIVSGAETPYSGGLMAGETNYSF